MWNTNVLTFSKWQLCFTYLAAKNVAKGGEGVVHGLVVDALVQVLDEDVADSGAPEGGVALAPHDADGPALQDVKVHGVQSALGWNGKNNMNTLIKITRK